MLTQLCILGSINWVPAAGLKVEIDAEFNGIPYVRKCCLFFTHESIIDQYVSVYVCCHCKVLDENAKRCHKPHQTQPLPLEACGLPSNTWMPGSTPLTTPNDSSIVVCTSTQLRRNKFPIGYNGTPQIHSQTAPSLRRSASKSNTPIPSPTPLTTLNGIRIQSAVLLQFTCEDRQMVGTNVPYQ